MFAEAKRNVANGQIRREGESGFSRADKVAPQPDSLWQSLALRPLAIQSKLAVSQPDDLYEQEADRVADSVMRMANPAREAAALGLTPLTSGKAQHKCGPCTDEEEDDRKLQRKEDGQTADSSANAPPIVNEALASGGGRLDPDIRAFMEPRFGHDFSDVRVHLDGQAHEAACSVDAQAFTRGRDIAFRSGHYSPLTQTGRRLLAHELAHVVQQRSAAATDTPLARQTFGTAKTTAPPAKNEAPGDVFRGILKNEVALFANAGVILDWIVASRGTGGGVASFSTTSLFADAAAMKKIKPKPKSAADLLPALEMLQYYEVIKRKDPDNWDIVLAPLPKGQTQPDVNRAKFDKNRTDITGFQKSFETRFSEKGKPTEPIAQQELLETTLAAGAKPEFKAQTEAETRLGDVRAEFREFVAFLKTGKPIFRVTSDTLAKDTVKGNPVLLLPIAGKKKRMAVDEADFDHIEPILTGKSKEVEARRKDIEKRQKTAQSSLFKAEGFHRFAVEMVWFLRELDEVSSIKFRAGTYGHHGRFGEYAADMYPEISENSERFYKIDKAEQFVDDINKVAEKGQDSWGKFAWQIVYNDTALQTKINKKYGPRMSSEPHHGPAPDKLHMHLDIRPLNLVADATTGFEVDESGRVRLKTP